MDETGGGNPSPDRARPPTPPDLGDVAERRVERTGRRRQLDRELQPYLADLERSLVAASVRESHVHDALATRTVIGQAIGLLMAHEGLTSEEGFARLVGVSQNANIKLRDIAARYVEAWEEKVNAGKPT
ncbi:MAG TPA: ANTAR domain-containing protein [Actinomycetota bacterium]|nr:ANTAR domain-containing protein [Actinomycetota bacterium]